jgi:hypothetical protein
MCPHGLRCPNGGRRTDPSWTERRQLPLRRETLERLQRLAALIRKQGGDVHPMQLAALLLEKATQDLSDDEVLGLVDAMDASISARSSGVISSSRTAVPSGRSMSATTALGRLSVRFCDGGFRD